MTHLLKSTLTITHITIDKKRYMPLLIIGDESADMINKYLDRGELFVGFICNNAVAVCVTTNEPGNITEVKNLAVSPEWQRQGIGRRLLSHVEQLNVGKTMTLGTGETPSTLNFYNSCGYSFSHRIPDFFTNNYPIPIIEDGILLKDMVYLIKQL